MAKLRMPKGDDFKVFSGEQAGECDGEGGYSTLVDNGEAATETATALLEGGEDDAGEDESTELEARIEENGDMGGEEYQQVPADDLPTGHYEQPAEGESAKVGEQPSSEPAATEQPAADADQPGVGESLVQEIADALGLAESAAAQARLQRALAIREWQQNCDEAKEKFVAAALAHAELKAATKIAKAEEEDAMEEYAKLVRQNPETNLAMVAISPARPCDAPIAEVAEAIAGESEATTLVDNGESTTPDAWRSTPISCLTSLTPKLIERLEEAGLTTMGKLEDRRAVIALSNGGEKWPKGIGEVKITAIEDAIIDWLTENRDREVFADLASGAMGEEVAEGESESTDGQAEGHESAAAQAAAILARASDIDNGEPDSLDEKIVDAGYWEQGWNHHQNGEKLETCDWSASAAQDDFIRGYLSAAKADGYSKKDAETAATLATPSIDDSLVDLNDL